jgi:integrase
MIQTRKRYQRGSLTKVGKQWIAQWWEDGHRRKARTDLNKTQAEQRLADILHPLNAASGAAPPTFGEFVEHTYLPFYRGQWKASTAGDNEGRLNFHLLSVYGRRTLESFSLEELQEFLHAKSADYSFSVTAHLRWTLNQIFRMAVNKGHLERNPAEELYIPKDAKRPTKEVMTEEQVQQMVNMLETREKLIAQLATIAGMRPGEILALKWGAVSDSALEVTQRLYRGKLDTPKTERGTRKVALSDGLMRTFEEWRAQSPFTSAEHWVFPSERIKTPLTRDNVWNRHMLPRLEPVGLGWATFQVMRRTNASLGHKVKVDPKVAADQRGHGIGVSLDVYTQSDLQQKRAAVNALEAALA